MKKTLIINIGNSIIHIEEDAYEILTNYLNEIKQHFAKNADDFEIVTDIENRIAEMFAEILESAKKQVIEITDVQTVILQMGSVKDFIGEEEESSSDTTGHANFEGEKKLYRDTDDGVIAGVCAGLGHYLNIELRWVRLFLLLTVFLGGAGVLAYIILWVTMPRAITRSEKMEMKGEATNLYGYKKSFEDELAAFKANMKTAGEHLHPIAKKSGNFIAEFITTIGSLIGTTGKIFLKIIAAIFVVCGFVTMVSLIICLAAFIGLWDANTFEIFPLSVINEGYRDEIILGAFVVCFIPVLVLVLYTIRVAFNRMAINTTLSFVLLVIWLIGVSATVYFTAKISTEFKEHAELVKTDQLKTYSALVLEIDQSVIFSKEDSLAFNMNEMNTDRRVIFDDNDDHPFGIPKNVRLFISKSDNEQTSLVQSYESQGKTFPIALRNAQNINYNYSQKDSLLTLSPRLALKQKSIWRDQGVSITLKVPVGTHLLLNERINNYLKFYYPYCQDNNSNTGNYREWVMTIDGLKCKADLDEQKIINP